MSKLNFREIDIIAIITARQAILTDNMAAATIRKTGATTGAMLDEEQCVGRSAMHFVSARLDVESDRRASGCS